MTLISTGENKGYEKVFLFLKHYLEDVIKRRSRRGATIENPTLYVHNQMKFIEEFSQ